MRKKRRPIAYRLIAFVLAFAMIFTSISFSDAGSIDAKAAEEDGWYWNESTLYIEDGSITKGELYSALVEKYGSGSYKYAASKPYLGWASGGTEVTSGDTDSIDVSRGAAAAGKKGRIWSSSTDCTFTVEYYYAITATVASGSPENASVSVGSSSVNHGMTTTLAITYVDGYSAKVLNGQNVVADLKDVVATNGQYTWETPAITASTAYTIEYTSTAAATYDVSLEVIDDNFGSATLSDSGALVEGKEVTITATPNENGYVSNIEVVGATFNDNGFGTDRVQTGTFTVGTEAVKVTVTFKEKKLVANSSGTIDVPYNPNLTITNQMADTIADKTKSLEYNIFKAVVNTNSSLPAGLTYDNDGLTYEYWADENYGLEDRGEWSLLNEKPVDFNILWESFSYYAFAQNGVGSTEKIRITWAGDSQYPAVTLEATIKLVDIRETQEATFSIGTSADNPIEIESSTGLQALLDTADNRSVTKGDGSITAVAFDATTLPDESKVPTEIEVTVSISGTDNYQATDYKTKVWVMLKEKPATVTISKTGNGTVVFGTLTETGTLAADSYDLVVTPTDANGYVKSVTIADSTSGETELVNLADDYTKYLSDGTRAFKLPSYAIENEASYTITVEFGTRTVGASTSIKVPVNGSLSKYDYSAIASAYKAGMTVEDIVVLDSCNPVASSYGEFYIVMSTSVYGDVKVANLSSVHATALDMPTTSKTLYAVWSGNNRYPEVRSEKITASIVDSRLAADITLGTFNGTAASEDAFKTAVKNAVTVKDTDGKTVDASNYTVEFAYANGYTSWSTVPNEITKYVVTVSIADGSNWLEYNKTFEVVGKMEDADNTITVTINPTTGGLAQVYNGEGLVAGTSITSKYDELYVVATPSSGHYLESIIVTDSDGSTIDITGEYNYHENGNVYINTSGWFTVSNGKAYTVTVTFAEWDIPIKDNFVDVFYKFHESYDSQKDTFLAQVYDAVVGSANTPDGITWAIELAGGKTEPTLGENSFVISWTAYDKYPAVSTTQTVNITANKQQAEIMVGSLGIVEIDGNDELGLVIDAVKAVTSVTTGAAEPVFDFAEGATAPMPGEEKTIEVVVEVAENDYTLAAKTTVEVTVVGKKHPSDISIVVNGAGTVSIGDITTTESVDGNSLVEGTYNITATPTNATGYVAEVSIVNSKGVSLATGYDDVGNYVNRVLTSTDLAIDHDEAYTLTVTFAERQLVLTDKTEIYINAYKSNAWDYSYIKSSYLSEVAADKFVDYNKSVGGTAKGNCVVRMSYFDGEDTIENIIDNYPVIYTGALDTSGTKELIIEWTGDNRYPTVTATKTVTIVEARPSVTVTVGTADALTATAATTNDEIIAKASAAVTINSTGANTPTYSVTNYTVPTQGQTVTATVTGTIAENASYIKTTFTVPVEVTGTLKKADVTVSREGEGTVTGLTDGEYTTRDITLTASPNEGWYVDKITVNDEAVNMTQLEGGIDFTSVINIVDGTGETLDAAQKTYDVKVYFVEQSIAVNETIVDVKYNPTKGLTEDVLNKVYASIVDETTTNGTREENLISVKVCKIELLEAEVLPEDYNTFRITWDASENDKYPAVSVEAGVKLTESRPTVIYTEKEISETEAIAVDGNLYTDDIEAAIKALAQANLYPADNSIVATYTYDENITAPLQGNVQWIEVTATVETTDDYIGATETILVPVKGIVHPATINVSSTGTGEVSLVDSVGNTIVDGNTHFSDRLTITATPDDAAKTYVSSIKVNGTELIGTDAEYGDNRSFTGSFDISDGAGTEASNKNTYDVVVTFTTYAIAHNATATIAINKGKDVSDQVADIESKIFKAVIADTSVSFADIESITAYGAYTVPGINRTWDGYYALGFGVNTEIFGYPIKFTWGDVVFNDPTEKIQITFPATSKYPAIIVDATLTIVDSRADSGLKDQTLDKLDFDGPDEVEAYVLTNLYNPNNLDVEVALKDGSALPTEYNTTKEVTYVVTFAGDETYKEGSCEITFEAHLKTAMCEVVADSTATSHGAITAGLGSVFGLTNHTITVTPDDGYAVKSISVKESIDGEFVDVSDVEYTFVDNTFLDDERTASVTFTTDGLDGPVTYTVYVEYEKIVFTLNSNPQISYCYDRDHTTLGSEGLKKLVFDAVYPANGNNPSVAVDKATVEYAYVGALGVNLYQDVGSDPTVSINGITHKFGEDGTETIRVTYSDDKYGKVQATVDLIVWDSCYNNTITYVENEVGIDGLEGSVKINTNSKTYGDVDYYKEDTEITVTVVPGNNGILSQYPSAAAYVKSIEVTAKPIGAGDDVQSVKVETSDIEFTAASEIFGVTYEEPTGSITFTTGSNMAYTVNVTYGVSEYVVTTGDVTFDKFEGVDEYYPDEYPTAEEIFAAVIDKGQTVEPWEKYSAENITVEYSTNSGISYESDLAGLMDIADGGTVKIRIKYSDVDNYQYHDLYATKDVVLKDSRTATSISATTITTVSYVNAEQLAENLKNALNAQVLLKEDASVLMDENGNPVEPVILYTPVDENNCITVTILYPGTVEGDGYKPSSITMENIQVEDLPDVSTLNVTSADGTGSVDIYNASNKLVQADVITATILGETPYYFVITPDSKYAVESVALTTSTGEEEELTVVDSEEIDGKLSLTYASKVASTKGDPSYIKELSTYTLTVTYVPNEFVFVEDAEIEFRYGIDDMSDAEQIVKLYDAAVAYPEYEDAYDSVDLDIKYLARADGDTVTIKIPDTPDILGVSLHSLLKAAGINPEQELELGELWLTPGEEYIEVDINALLAEYEEKIKNISSVTELTEIAQDLIALIEDIPNMEIGGHEFGEGGDGSYETICVGYDDDKYVINMENGVIADVNNTDTAIYTTVKIYDPREATTITGADATVTYGASYVDIYAALGIGVLGADGESTGEIATIISKVEKLDAGDTYEILVKYEGNEKYQPSSATFNLTVEKAICDIDYDSQLVEYGTPYEFELKTNPEGVDAFEFVIGLDLSSMEEDNLIPSGYIVMNLPGTLGKLISADMNLADLIKYLGDLVNSSEAILSGLGIDAETLETIVNVLTSVTDAIEGADELIVRINVDDIRPTDVGVYIAAAVTYDSNYETAYTVDYLVIYPKAVNATADWRFEDSNGIIMKNLLEDNLYDLGANGYIDGKLDETATDYVKHIFLQLGVDGNFELIYAKDNAAIADNMDKLTETGAYAQISMVLDWGNELYYSAPIARAYVVIPEILNVDFVDETGAESHAFTEVFDGTPHDLDVVVSDNYGHVYTDEELEGYFTVTYYGYTLNNPDQIYESAVAPTDAGVYTAVATFIDTEGGRYGADAALLTIKGAEATIDVENQSVTYGDDYGLGITSNPADCKYISIVAGIDAGGQISFEDLNPLSGSVNIDFPSRMDKILKAYMPEAYTVGISANELINSLGEMSELLEEYGLPAEAVNTIQSVLDMIPETELGEHKITFKDNVVPKNVGLYIVAGVTCDPNYTFGADIGYLMVAPDSHNAELAFNYTDDNHIFTLNYIKNGDIDLGSHVVVGGDMTADMAIEAEKQLVNIYLGIGTDGQISISNEPIKAHGAYTQIAYLEVTNLNSFYYAEPIIRGYLVVPETVKVEFVDETGAVNPDRMFTHTGDPIEMPVKVTHNNGTDLSGNEALTVTYLGYDAKGIQIYNSTTPPTNIGAYTVIAVYADKEADLYGMAIGAMVIGQADATIEVKDQHVLMGDDYDLGITVTPESCETIKVVAGITTDASSLESAVNSIAAAVNVDFPDSMDVYLQKYLPEAYGEGMTINEMIEVLNKLPDKLAEKGLSEDVVEALREVIGQIPVTELGEQIVTFKNDVVPQELGVYMVGAVACDLNYKAAYDTGYLIIGDIVDVTLVDEAGAEMSAAEYTYDGTPKGVLATVVDSDGNAVSEEDIAKYLTITYTGYSLNNPTEIYSSTEAPVHAGVYTATAVFADHDKGRFGAAVGAIVINMAESTITVEDQVVSGLDPYDLGITVTPEDCKYISIVAGVNVGGDQISDALGTVAGAVNVDFPSRVDDLLKQYIPEAYEGGMTVNELLSKLSQMAGKLGEYGMPEDIVTALQEAFGQIPVEEIGEQVVTFEDDYLPTQLGVYAVAAVTCDPDYIPAADAGYLLIGELVDVTFVDGEGNAIDSQTVTYDGTPKSMNVKVTREDGTVLDAADNLTVTYLGFDANGVEIYNSTTPPTNVGIYSAIASYYAPNKGLVGMAVGVMTIQPAEATIDVENQMGGVGEITSLGIKVTPEDCKYISIVAGLNAGQTELDNLLGTVTGTVNIDFPTRIDAVLKAYAPGIYEENTTVNDLIAELQAIVEKLEKVGVDTETIAEIQNVIGQIPTEGIGDQVVTFADGFVPTDMGAYAVAAVTCDPNYTVASDVGYILIGEIVDVTFENQTFTYDGTPHGLVPVVTDADGNVLDNANAFVTYLGYDANDIQIYNSTDAPTNAGVYSAIAVYYDAKAGHVGIGAGVLTIKPGEAAIDVENMTVPANTAYELDITVTPEDCDYISIVVGIQAGDELIAVPTADQGIVYIDFPERIDTILQKYVPGIYAENMTVDGMLAAMSEAVAQLAEFGISESVITAIQDAMTQMPVSDVKDMKVSVVDGYVPQHMGAYAVAAVTCDINYTVDADLGYLLVGEAVDVTFAGGSSQTVTYNGQPQGMDVEVRTAEGTVLTNADALSVTYLGYDAKGVEIYNSTEAPTNAGIYTVTAVYYDSANGHVGLAVGLLTILPADASIDVAEQTVSVGAEYDLGITVDPKDCGYVSIVAGLNAGGSEVTDLLGTVKGAVNVDFPERIDEVLYELIPEAYEGGMTVNEMIAKLQSLVDKLSEYGIDDSVVTEIQNAIGQIPVEGIGDQLITFTDGYVPTEMGVYAVAAVTCDANYKPAADLGYLLVGETVEVKIPNQSFTYNGQPQGVDVQVVTADGKVLDNADALTLTYLGYDANDIQIYNSTEAPTNAGIYTAVAVYYDAKAGQVGIGTGLMTIKPADASISVENQTAGVGEVTSLGITATPEDCKYISIVAGLDVSGSQITNVADKTTTVVNIDFPAKVDAVLKAYAPGICEEGTTVNDLIAELNGIVDRLAALGIDEATIAEIQNVIGQIPTEGIGDQLITFQDGFVPNTMGAYAVAAITCDPNYEVAADLGFILIGEAVNVELGSQTFVYNGQPQGMSATVTTADGTVIGNTDEVTFIYLGYDAKGVEIYNSTTPPTNVGAYTAIAVYYNAAAGYVGLGTGMMAITPAESAIDVESQTAKVGTDYEIKVTVTPEDVAYTTIVAGINVKGSDITNIANTATGVVNIDFPAEIDSILHKYVPEIYNEGTTVNGLIAELSDMVTVLAEYGVSESFVTEIQDVIAQIPASDLGDQLITFKDGFAPKEMGVYAVAAVTSDVNYQVAGDVGFLLVGDTVEVQFLDAAGNVTDYTSFPYNGQPQGLTTKVVTSDGTELTNADALLVNYIGFDAKGIEFYNSTNAPVNAGLYVQSAIYFDAATGYVGAGVGTFTIGQGAATIDVANQNVTLDSSYDLGITVTPENCDYISIVAGLKVEGDSLMDMVGSVGGTVNVDFPESIDAIFEELMPEEYANGMTINEMIEKLGQIPEELKAVGVPASITDEIQNVVNQIPVTDLGNMLVTFTDGYVPSEMGIYAVGAVTCDVNYTTAADIGYLVVGQSVDIKFIDDNGNENASVVYTYDGQPHGLKVQVTAADGTDLTDSDKLTYTYIGADAGGLGVYNSTEPPKNAGVYTVAAMYYDDVTGQMGIGIGIVAIEPRPLSIKIHDAEKLVGGIDPVYTYEVISGLVDGDALTLAFEREEGEAPGEYAIKTSLYDFAKNMNYSITAEEGTLTIKERDIVITLDDITVAYGKEPVITYDIDYTNALVPDTLRDIIVLYDVSYGDATDVGTYDITAKATFVDGKNPVVDMNYADIYNLTVVGGKLTIEAKSISGATVMGHNDVIYNGSTQTFDNLIVIDGKTVLTEGVDYTVEYRSNVNVGESVIVITGMGNYFGEKTATFNITEADNEWSKQLSIQGWTYGEYDPAVNSPSAESVASGTSVSYEYFADKDCTKTLMEAIGQAVPTVTTPVGTYYVRATAYDTDSDNFKPLVSEAVAFTVTPKSIAGARVTVANDNLTYNGKEQKPSSVMVIVDGKELTAGTDYYVTYANNVDAGTAVVTITGAGNYIDVATGSYVIAKASLAGAVIAGLDAQTQTYDGTAKTPVPTVQLDGVTIGKYNYDVTYGNNVNAGTATVTVTATADSNYTGSVTANFTIGKATNRWTDQLTMAGWEYGKYNAQDNAPDAAALFGDVTYTFYTNAGNSFTPSAETDAGTYYVKAEVAETANYSGIASTTTFTVGKAYLPVPTLEYTTVVFDGTAKTPTVVIDDVDPAYFTVSYTDNTEVGTAVVTVSAANAGNYYGSHTLVFKITPMSVTNAEVDDLADLVYTGKALTHADSEFSVKVDGKELVFGTDYTVSYTNNVNVGTATAVIKLTGNYEGTVTKEFNILPAALPGAALEYESVAFDGTAKQPKVTINGLVEDVDFVVTYPADSVNVGSYKVVITAAEGSNYTGTIEKTFMITQGNVANASVTAADLVYTGKAVKHDASDASQFRVVMNGIVLDPQTDYYASYANNTAAGINTATVTIIGTGNYTGSITANFSICAAQNEWTKEISMSADTWEYGTNPTKPTATAKFGKVSYEYFTDPACEYSVPAPDKNTAAGTYYVRAVVEATEAYTGLVGDTIQFTITAKSLENATVNINETKVYNGLEQYLEGSDITVKLGSKKLEEGLDYFVDRYENNVNASAEAKVVIIGIGNYEGEVIGTFTIKQAENRWYENVQIGDWTYGDEPCEPWANAEFGNDTITFKYFTDKSCKKPVDGVPTEAGEYYVKAYVEETTNYAGLETKNAVKFTIHPRWFDSIEMEYLEVGYDGTAKTPEVTVTGVNGTTLVEGTDYEVTYTDNVEAGIATVVITGKGNYEGEWTEQFIIMPIQIDDADISGIEDKVYTGKPAEQDLTIVVDGVTLTPGKDYVIEYVGDNVEVGTVYMYVYGNGNYDCSLLKVFQILPADLADATLSYTTVEEDGDAKTPSVVVKGIKGATLTEGTDYYVTYADNVKPGTATVTVNGIGNYAGSQIVKTFTITAKEVIPPVEPEYAITDAALEYTVTVYDGAAKTPSVTVKDGRIVLEAETDYIVSYKDNVNAGTATVTIKGIGNYKGEQIQKTFQIGKADNAWTKELAITDWSYGEYNAILNAPSAAAKVGTPVYEYFKVVVGDNGAIETVALDKVPTEVGLYIVKATVAESANYKALTSSLVDFNISPKSLTDDNVKVTGLEDKTYTGAAQTLEGLKVTVGGKELVIGKDITVSYENNVNAGTATVTIKAASGSGYTESITATFDIEAAALPGAALEYTEVEADGTAKTPAVTIEGLKEGKDFTVAYLENVEPGRAVVTVTGMGNYEGTQVLTFEITAKEEVPPTMYTVTFDTLGGSAVDPITAEEGTEIVLPEAPEKDGADFLGWALTAEAEEAQYQPGDKMAVTADITVYAVWDADDVTQIYGKGRYQTALGIAENLKAEMGVDKFNTIIVATGENFADALSGSYLSHVKNAPILLINGGSAAEVTAYINANLVSGGKVYVLGGDAAVKESWISGIKSSNIERLKGKTRYETNIEILKEAGVTSGELLVATGEVFADSLSAASAKRPIFLVKGDSLSAAQKEFLSGLRGDSYTIIGGAAAVSNAMEDQIAKYGNIDRVKGKTRYQTSIAVAESFVSNPEAIVVAYGENFPDGLCGGLLAIVSGSPVILSSDGNAEGTASYITKYGITEGYVLGGNACFTDESIAKMFGIETSDIVKFRYPDAVK